MSVEGVSRNLGRWISVGRLRLDRGERKRGRRPTTVAPAVAPWPESLAPRRSWWIRRFSASFFNPRAQEARRAQGKLT